MLSEYDTTHKLNMWVDFPRDPFAPQLASSQRRSMEQERSQHQWHLIFCLYQEVSSALGFFSLFLTHTLKYHLHQFPPPMSTSLKCTRVWYLRSRVRCHCAWIGSNISAEAMESQTLPRHAETHLSLSTKPVKGPTMSYTYPCLLPDCATH